MAECTNMVGHGWRCAAPTLCKECVLRNERNQLQTALAQAKAEHVRLEAERDAARERETESHAAAESAIASHMDLTESRNRARAEVAEVIELVEWLATRGGRMEQKDFGPHVGWVRIQWFSAEDKLHVVHYDGSLLEALRAARAQAEAADPGGE